MGWKSIFKSNGELIADWHGVSFLNDTEMLFWNDSCLWVPFLNGMKYHFEMIDCGGIFFSMIQKCCFEMTQLVMVEVTSKIRRSMFKWNGELILDMGVVSFLNDTEMLFWNVSSPWGVFS